MKKEKVPATNAPIVKDNKVVSMKSDATVKRELLGDEVQYPIEVNTELTGDYLDAIAKLDIQASQALESHATTKKHRLDMVQDAKSVLMSEAQALQDAEIAFLKAQNAYILQKNKVQEAGAKMEKIMLENMVADEKAAGISGQLSNFKYGIRTAFLISQGYDQKRIKNMKITGNEIKFNYIAPIEPKE